LKIILTGFAYINQLYKAFLNKNENPRPTGVSALATETSMENEELLCEAARNGDIDKLKSLIDSGADSTYFDKVGVTPLMHAAKHGHAEVVQSLLDAGAPWNALSPSNRSAGDFAMDAGHQAAVDILLNAGQWTNSDIANPS
jgi:ankyrin repeat protein